MQDGLKIDMWLNAVTLVCDLCLAMQSARGTMMEVEKRQTFCLQASVCLKVLLGMAVQVNFVIMLYKSLRTIFQMDREDVLDSDWEFEIENATRIEIPGWGLGFSDWKWPPVVAIFTYLIACTILFFWASIVYAGLMIPKDTSGDIATRSVRRALAVAGTQSDLIDGIVEVMMKTLGTATFEVLVPSDLAVGLVLVQAKQQQGVWFSFDNCARTKRRRLAPEEESCSESDDDNYLAQSARVAARARIREVGSFGADANLTPRGRRVEVAGSDGHVSVFPRQRAVITPLGRRDSVEGSTCDAGALKEFVHWMPLICGIYGWKMNLLGDVMQAGTSIPKPCQVCCIARESFPSGSWRCGAREGFNDFALRRKAHDGHAQEGGVDPPEVLWSTWENRGPGTSPPLAVVLDREWRRLVVVVRGTMDVKDAIADIGAKSVFFDPFGWAGPSEKRESPFDEEHDLFVHGVIHKCAADAMERLSGSGILASASSKGGRAEGFGLVFVGHSLGAGIACLLAMMHHKEFPDARYVGVEPPGGLLSRRLARETVRLGWMSSVCSHDWVPHLSVKAMQLLREEVIDEIEGCDRSKWQIFLVFLGRAVMLAPRWICPCRLALGGLLERAGGGPLHIKNPVMKRQVSFMSPLRLARQSKSFWSEELFPPGRLAYFRPLAQEPLLCGYYLRDCRTTAHWIEPEALISALVLSSRTLELHFPWVIQDIFHLALREANDADSSGYPMDSSGYSGYSSSSWGSSSESEESCCV